MIIRQENKEDYGTIYELVKTAFETAEVSNGREHEIVNNIRTGKNYIPRLALVAEIYGEIVGHIMFTKTYVEEGDVAFEALLLAPLSVKAEHRRRDIGSKLVLEGIKLAKTMGYKAIFLVGNKEYYSRFGFVPASDYGIKFSPDIPEELTGNAMAYELVPGALTGVHGLVNITLE